MTRAAAKETLLSVVIPTLGRPALLSRVLHHLDRQTVAECSFEVIVVADANEQQIEALDRVIERRAYRVRRLQSGRPGASAARNVGWRASTAPLVLFMDDDILPGRHLVSEHQRWHARHTAPEIGVLGRVRWASELRVTPFMRWLERGIQFDYPSIQSEEAGWGHFYTANVSVKRELIARVGGFDEERLPYGYEDLDLALRMHREQGFRLLYNRGAEAEHLHRMDLDFWRRRVARVAVSERQFVALHPELPGYFFELFSAAARCPPVHKSGRHLARFVPRWVPLVGPRVWASADGYYLQALAGPFLEAWHRAEQSIDHPYADSAGPPSSAGSPPAGPK